MFALSFRIARHYALWEIVESQILVPFGLSMAKLITFLT